MDEGGRDPLDALAPMPTSLVSGLLILLGLNLAGEALMGALGVPVPGSVVGMVALAVLLRRGWLRAETVRPAADVLLRNLALFFVPPGVGLMLFFDLVAAEWWAIAAGNVVGMVAVLLVVGWLHDRLAPRTEPPQTEAVDG